MSIKVFGLHEKKKVSPITVVETELEAIEICYSFETTTETLITDILLYYKFRKISFVTTNKPHPQSDNMQEVFQALLHWQRWKKKNE